MYRRCGFRHERKLRALGILTIAGIDEAGRGALAGPVVAAAVILPEKFRHRRLNDSKQLLPEKREEIYCELTANDSIAWAIGIVDSVEMCAAVRDAIEDFVAQHPSQGGFEKRQRDRADPEALARRGPRSRGET